MRMLAYKDRPAGREELKEGAMKAAKDTSMILTYVDDSLRKVENGMTMAIENGRSLGISFRERGNKEMKTFKLDSGEIELLIQYLKGSVSTFIKA